jgi:hypothetical protein
MSDYRDPSDPMWRNTSYEPKASGYGWVAGAAVFLVVVVAIAFGIRHGTIETALDDVTPPAATHVATPPTALDPPVAPGLTPPPAAAPAPVPAPNRQ